MTEQTRTALTRRIRAHNPGPMTLDGTNSYIIAADSSAPVVIVDPGPLEEAHLAALAGAGTVELILVTHHHPDHTDGSARLHELTGAPVRAADPAFCHGGETLHDGEVIHAGGVDITVLATPGHTSDSLCFWLKNDGDHGSVLTGDTVLGQGTTVISYPDGTLGDYLASLETLGSLGPATVLPGHGPALPDLAAVARLYQAHRGERLAQVRAAVARLGGDPEAAAVAELVYADVPANVRAAARLSVQAQLDYLRSTDRHT